MPDTVLGSGDTPVPKTEVLFYQCLMELAFQAGKQALNGPTSK